jgi:hypothetical protein
LRTPLNEKNIIVNFGGNISPIMPKEDTLNGQNMIPLVRSDQKKNINPKEFIPIIPTNIEMSD